MTCPLNFQGCKAASELKAGKGSGKELQGTLGTILLWTEAMNKALILDTAFSVVWEVTPGWTAYGNDSGSSEGPYRDTWTLWTEDLGDQPKELGHDKPRTSSTNPHDWISHLAVSNVIYFLPVHWPGCWKDLVAYTLSSQI